jgi:hypothetical protein
LDGVAAAMLAQLLQQEGIGVRMVPYAAVSRTWVDLTA